jgi:hypothetical protein
MTWTPSLAIAGGVLALGPIIIHILFRHRYRIIEFAAMRFLVDSLRRAKQRILLEELILIALRVLACLLIGFMLANLRASSPLPTRAAATANVFILDDSLSMGQQAGNMTVLQRALDQLAQSIRDLQDDDLVAIITATQPDSGQPLAALTPAVDAKRADFLQRLSAWKPSDERARLPAALASAQKILAAHTGMAGRIILVSDYRRLEFGETGAAAEELRRAFAAASGAKLDLVLLDFGLPGKDNLTIEKLALTHKLAVAGVPTRFQVTVRNHGATATEGASVTPRAGDVVLPSVPLPALPPGESATVNFEYVFSSAGSGAVTATLTGDALAGDNFAALALHVRESLRVLIVDGSPDPSKPSSASFCLVYALDPSGQGAFGQRVEVVTPEALNPDTLDDFDLVVLANVREFAVARDASGAAVYPQLQALQKYVHRGGGLGIFLGDRINVDFYNGPLHENGVGLNPFKLATQPLAAPDPSIFVRLRPDSIGAEPMLRIFTGKTEKFAQLIRFYVHVPVQPDSLVATVANDEVGPAQVLARFDDYADSPAVVRRRYGQGSVILWLTAPNGWSDWPRSFSFVPVVNDMAWELARGVGATFNGPVGQEIAYTLPASLGDATAVVLKTPGYPEEDLQVLMPRIEGNRKVVNWAATQRAGLYELEFTLADRTRRTVLFSRQIDEAEGDLAKAAEQQIAAAVAVPHRYSNMVEKTRADQGKESPGKTYWWLFLLVLVAVLAVENWLARRFAHHVTTKGLASAR